MSWEGGGGELENSVAWRWARRIPNQVVWVRNLARSLCCVLAQNTLLPQCLSPARSINRHQQAVWETRENNGGRRVGGNPAIDWLIVQGEKQYSWSLHVLEAGKIFFPWILKKYGLFVFFLGTICWEQDCIHKYRGKHLLKSSRFIFRSDEGLLLE